LCRITLSLSFVKKSPKTNIAYINHLRRLCLTRTNININIYNKFTTMPGTCLNQRLTKEKKLPEKPNIFKETRIRIPTQKENDKRQLVISLSSCNHLVFNPWVIFWKKSVFSEMNILL
jgi:hypothetical protein